MLPLWSPKSHNLQANWLPVVLTWRLKRRLPTRCWGPRVEASRLWIGHMVKYFRKILPRIFLLSHLYTKNEWLFLIFESQNGAGGRAHPWVLISTSWLGASLSISLSKCLPSPNKSYSSRRKPEGIYLSYNSDSWGVILHKAAMWRGLAFVIFW